MHTIFLNIETIPPRGSSPDPERVKVPGNYSKPESIAAYKREHMVDAWRRMALEPLEAQVCIVSLLDGREDNNKPQVLECEDEPELLSAAQDLLVKLDESRPPGVPLNFCTWNGIGFDYPVLKWRALKYGLCRMYGLLCGAGRWPTERYQDLMVTLGGRDFVSLDRAATYLDIPNDNPIQGSQICDLIWTKQHDLVLAHTRSRVTLLKQIAKKMGTRTW